MEGPYFVLHGNQRSHPGDHMRTTGRFGTLEEAREYADQFRYPAIFKEYTDGFFGPVPRFPASRKRRFKNSWMKTRKK